MYFSLIRKMVNKYFVQSGLADYHELKIRYFYDSVEIRSPYWDKGVVLIIYESPIGYGADLRFYYGKKTTGSDWLDMFYSLDSFPAMDEKGFYCTQCSPRKYFNSIEELIYDELFKGIIEEIEAEKYEREVRFGSGWAQFVDEENEEKNE